MQVAESSCAKVPGRENPVEAPDDRHWEQVAKPSCAEVAGLDRPDEAPDDACQDMGKTSNARIAREEIPAETPDGQEVAELIGDQVTGLDRHVEAPGDGH